MKIGQLEPKAVATSAKSERAATTGPAAKSGGPSAEPSAQVELSPAALMAGGDSAEFDAEKVQRIAQAFREGKYKINAEAIADKLIGNAQELLSRTSH